MPHARPARRASGPSAPAALAALVLAAPALAQEDRFELPNPLQRGNLAATCATWEDQVAATDERAVALVVGVWDGQRVQPGVPGLTPDALIQVRAVNAPDHTFQVQEYSCRQLESVAPELGQFGPACSTTTIYGWWTAHFGPGGEASREVVVATLSSGSGGTGGVLAMSCAAGSVRFLDADTMQGMDGGVSRRAR